MLIFYINLGVKNILVVCTGCNIKKYNIALTLIIFMNDNITCLSIHHTILSEMPYMVTYFSSTSEPWCESLVTVSSLPSLCSLRSEVLISGVSSAVEATCDACDFGELEF